MLFNKFTTYQYYFMIYLKQNSLFFSKILYILKIIYNLMYFKLKHYKQKIKIFMKQCINLTDMSLYWLSVLSDLNLLF